MTRPWLLVAGDFTPFGGMDSANHALARYLADRRGAEVHLVTHRAWQDLARQPNVFVHQVRRPFDRHLLGRPLMARAGRRLCERLSARGVRVLSNGGNCETRGANWVHYVHAAYLPGSDGSPARRARQWLTHRADCEAERRALHSAEVVICNSERTARDVVEKVGVPASRVRVVYYGSDPERFSPVAPGAQREAKTRLGWDPDRKVVGFIGALGDRRKAFDSVFDAWRRLAADPGWDADLMVVGTGAELPAWRWRVGDAGLAGRVHFLGYREDVPDLLAGFDALVHPARYEAYGLAVHEALARGIPALVSASAGVAERYPDALRPLLIHDPDDPAEVGERLRQWRASGEALREGVRQFSDRLRTRTWDHMAEEIVGLVEQAA